MELNAAVIALAALAQETRLAIFRLLVEAWIRMGGGRPNRRVVEGSKRKAFFKAHTELHRRISLFINNLPFDKLSNLALKEKLDEIGRTQ